MFRCGQRQASRSAPQPAGGRNQPDGRYGNSSERLFAVYAHTLAVCTTSLLCICTTPSLHLHFSLFCMTEKIFAQFMHVNCLPCLPVERLSLLVLFLRYSRVSAYLCFVAFRSFSLFTESRVQGVVGTEVKSNHVADVDAAPCSHNNPNARIAS